MAPRKTRATEIYEGLAAALGGQSNSAYLLLARILLEGILKEPVQLPEEPAAPSPPGDE